jgi:glycerophosphoryl diester phosphodiesterase
MTKNPLIVAHRGASRDAPENTLAAYMMAWLQHADALEADLRLTKDGQIVCIHDADTGRVCGKTLVVAESSLATLQQLDVGVKLFPKWKGQQIPTLKQVIASKPAGKSLFLEIKTGARMLPLLKKELVSSALNPAEVVIQSFDGKVLEEAASTLPGYRTLLLVHQRRLGQPPSWQPPMESLIAMFRRSKAAGVNLNAPTLLRNPDLVTALMELGAELHTWTVNRATGARPLLALGLSSITTDRPGRMRAGLRW